MMKNTPFSTRNMISRKLSHSSNVSEGNVMVGGKPVCDDNWGMEEVNKLDTQTRKNLKEEFEDKDKDIEKDKKLYLTD